MSLGIPSLVPPRPAASAKVLRLIVSGEDAVGKPFRENAAVVRLQGAECTYESRSRTQPGSSLMIEIPAARVGEPSWRTAAIVESVSSAGTVLDFFHVNVLLGRAYEPASPAGSIPAPIQPSSLRQAEQSDEQQLMRTTALLKPVIAEMVREAVLAETATQARQLRGALSCEIESAVREPLAVMVQYAESLPAIDQQMVRRLVGQAAETEFQRAIVAIAPAIAETLRSAVAAEYERQTQQLRAEIIIEVGKAVQGPVALQMAVMLDKALAPRGSTGARQDCPPQFAQASVEELMLQLQIKLDASGGTMRCMLEPKVNGSRPAGGISSENLRSTAERKKFDERDQEDQNDG